MPEALLWLYLLVTALLIFVAFGVWLNEQGPYGNLRTRRESARMFFLAPLWPFMVIGAVAQTLRKISKDAWRTERGGSNG